MNNAPIEKFPNNAKNGDIVVATIQFVYYEGKWIGINNLRVSGIFQRIDPLVIFGGEMTDLEKFRQFFKPYGIEIVKSAHSDDEYTMDGDKVDLTIQCGSSWYFDKDGNFLRVEEGS